MGLQPDGIIGHSLGEVACGYADGCLSQEEAVLTAYWRGQCIKEANIPPGAMAAVGRRCPVLFGQTRGPGGLVVPSTLANGCQCRPVWFHCASKPNPCGARTNPIRTYRAFDEMSVMSFLLALIHGQKELWASWLREGDPWGCGSDVFAQDETGGKSLVKALLPRLS